MWLLRDSALSGLITDASRNSGDKQQTFARRRKHNVTSSGALCRFSRALRVVYVFRLRASTTQPGMQWEIQRVSDQHVIPKAENGEKKSNQAKRDLLLRVRRLGRGTCMETTQSGNVCKSVKALEKVTRSANALCFFPVFLAVLCRVCSSPCTKATPQSSPNCLSLLIIISAFEPKLLTSSVYRSP